MLLIGAVPHSNGSQADPGSDRLGPGSADVHEEGIILFE